MLVIYMNNKQTRRDPGLRKAIGKNPNFGEDPDPFNRKLSWLNVALFLRTAQLEHVLSEFTQEYNT